MADLASAARCVAEDIRLGRHSLPDDLDAIKPLLDAVAAGAGDEGRVERWAKVCAEAGFHAWPETDGYNDRAEKRAWQTIARAAIALADAEGTVRAEAGWVPYEAAWDEAFVAARPYVGNATNAIIDGDVCDAPARASGIRGTER